MHAMRSMGFDLLGRIGRSTNGTREIWVHLRFKLRSITFSDEQQITTTQIEACWHILEHSMQIEWSG